MEFGPTKIEKRTFNGKDQDVSVSPGCRKDIECDICDGKGYDIYNDENGKPAKYPCGLCKGTGKLDQFVCAGPEMNVSSANGMEIQRMIGVKPDHGGIVWNKDLPVLMRKLIMLKNGDTSAFTKDQNIDRGEMRARKNDDGTTSIGRGPTMHDMGRTQNQVNSYVDRLMEIVKWCIDNGYDLSWA